MSSAKSLSLRYTSEFNWMLSLLVLLSVYSVVTVKSSDDRMQPRFTPDRIRKKNFWLSGVFTQPSLPSYSGAISVKIFSKIPSIVGSCTDSGDLPSQMPSQNK